MRLDTLINVIADSSSDEWETVSAPPAVDAYGHDARAVHREDVSIALAWGLVENDNFRQDWANRFADPAARSHWVDVLYQGSLVARDMYVAVDGYRCFLPVPRLELEGELPDAKVIGRTITQQEYGFFRLLDSLGGSYKEFDSYLARADIRVVG